MAVSYTHLDVYKRQDIKILEEILWSEVGTKQDYEAEYGEKPLGEFVREIVGLDTVSYTHLEHLIM